MKTFEKFLRSRNGMLSLFGGLVILLLIAAYFSGTLGRITGTAGIPYPMPPNGFTCLPTCAENDARMFDLAGSKSLSNTTPTLRIWIMVPSDQPTFTLGIFDGDAGKSSDNTLALYANSYTNFSNGNWDDSNTGDTTYTLYADPLADGSGQTALASWLGNEVMPNNAWWETTLTSDPQAQGANEQYYYRLEATRPVESLGGQAFKVRASGYLMTGQRQEWPVGLAAMLPTLQDYKIVYPEFVSNIKPGSQTTYNGDWQLSFKVSSEVRKIEIWDGGFDRIGDTDDLNTTGKPAWTSTLAIDEGVSNDSNRKDDNSNILFKVSPAVYYEILDPDGQSIYINNNPSGAKDWENTTLSADSTDSPDALSTKPFPAGTYTLHIVGMDMQNAFWIGVNYPICDPNSGCPPMPNEQ